MRLNETPANSETIRVNIQPEAYFDDIELFEDKKEYIAWMYRMKKLIRDSFEYEHELIPFLKKKTGMDHCGFHPNQKMEDGFRIELHHTPFVLEDIVDIVVRKRLANGQSMKMQEIAHEVMELHYLGLAGLYPLCMICHAIIHDPNLDPMFIPMGKVRGDPTGFAELYWPYFSDSMQTKWQNLQTLEKSYQLITQNMPIELQKKFIYIKPYEDDDTEVVGTNRLIDFTNLINSPHPVDGEGEVEDLERDEDGFWVLHRRDAS